MFKKLLQSLRKADRRNVLDMRDFVQGFWGVRVASPEGEIVHDKSGVSNSWTKNAYNVAFCSIALMNHNWNSNLYIYQSSGSLLFVSAPISWTGVHAAAPDNNDARGILVGRSDDPEDFTDYNLTLKCPHGDGTNELDHQLQTDSPDFNWDDTNKILEVEHYRTFYNESGASITVEEIGLFDGVGNGVMMARDLVGSTAIANLYTLQVTYKFKVTYTPIAP